MKERPVLFSAPMVRAILEVRKTMTRRVMKLQPDDDGIVTVGQIGTSCGVAYVGNKTDGGLVTRVPCPYGQPGDRLWVKETHILIDNRDGGRKILYKADAGEKVIHPGHGDDDWRGDSKWRPSIFMRREYSRITLEITNVRVERLQEISYEDALAEGATDFSGLIESNYHYSESPEQCARRLKWPQRRFRAIWNSINGPDAWDKNPWIWVIEFKRVVA